jgi:hypothetical protein
MRSAVSLVVLALLGGLGHSAWAEGCEPRRCTGLVGFVPVLYSQSEIWWDSIAFNGKTVKNNQHVFVERGVPGVNATVTLDWEGLPLMVSGEVQANIEALGSFDPKPDGSAEGLVLEHPKVIGAKTMHRGAKLRILSYQVFPQTRSSGIFSHDEVVRDLLFALVRYEGDPAPTN